MRRATRAAGWVFPTARPIVTSVIPIEDELRSERADLKQAARGGVGRVAEPNAEPRRCSSLPTATSLRMRHAAWR